ncbi:MAG: pyocin knob domain-containing protein [Vibrio gallaecicus]
MACEDYPTVETAKRFNADAETLNEVITSSNAVTPPASDGREKLTLRGLQSLYINTQINLPSGQWAAGVTFTAANQYMAFNGVGYKLKSTVPLPYVTLGNDPTSGPDIGNVEVFNDVTYQQVLDEFDNFSQNFGFGSPNAVLPPNNNLNDVVNTGMYSTDSGTANSVGGTANSIISIVFSALLQTQLLQTRSGVLYKRTKDTVWSAWGLVTPNVASEAEAKAHTDNVNIMSSLRAFNAFSQYGIGSPNGILPPNNNLNDVVRTGIYSTDSGTANSVGGTANSIFVTVFGVNNQTQLLLTRAGLMYIRTKDTVWGSWIVQQPTPSGQTWTDVTGSRIPAVTYTNSTPYVMQVFIRLDATGPGTRTLTINGLPMPIGLASVSGADTLHQTIIPAGATYSYDSSFSFWAEMQ